MFRGHHPPTYPAAGSATDHVGLAGKWYASYNTGKGILQRKIDPGFPTGKLHENDENRTGGVHPKFHCVDPPLHCLCLTVMKTWLRGYRGIRKKEEYMDNRWRTNLFFDSFREVWTQIHKRLSFCSWRGGGMSAQRRCTLPVADPGFS